jgi:hypothetical protein
LDETGQVVPLRGGGQDRREYAGESPFHRHIAAAHSVKVIDENRRLINQYLDLTGGDAFPIHTDLVGRSFKALNKFPNLNNAYQDTDGRPSRVERRRSAWAWQWMSSGRGSAAF